MKTRTVSITVRRSGRDRFGDKTGTVEHSIGGWVFAPTASTEDTEHHGDQVSTRQTGYGPPGADVVAADEVVTPDGLVWQVDGAPLRYVDPYPYGPNLDSTVIYLERVTG